MNGYIFDWNENSEKILESGEYTTVGHQFMEQVALFRYLMNEGKTKNEVDEIWRGTNSIIYQKCCDDADEIERLFARIWGKAAKWKNNFKGNEIVIYQSEIDFINNMEVLPWIKQYVLTLLCVYKWWGREWCKYDKKIRTFCFSCTDAKREVDRHSTKLKECLNKYKIYESKIIDTNIAFRFKDISNNLHDVLLTINNPREIEVVKKYLKNYKKCIKCGNMFEYNAHNMNNELCPTCHKIKRNIGKSAKRCGTQSTFLNI